MGIEYKLDCENVDWKAMHDVLIADDFHNGRSVEQYQQSFENSHTVVIAYDDGNIIGTARALSDGVCNAYVVDVWTLSAYRRQGIARKMMALVLEQLQGQHVYLWTDDAQHFYKSLGMTEESDHTGFSRVVGDWLVNHPED